MNTIIESAKIALAAIWSSKLRSFMTVLGNIVAVTSIIAVVSLIQGLNASVKQAILDEAGAESFSIQRFPVTRSDEDIDRVRNNPIITMQDMRAIQRYGGDNIAAVMANSGGRGRITFRDKSIDNTQVEGVSAGYVNFSGYAAERGRLMSPIEVERSRPVTVLGWQTADRLFGSNVDPIDKIIQVEGVHFQVVGVSEKKGSMLGQSQDSFAIIPLGQFAMMFGSRRSLDLTDQAQGRRQHGRGPGRSDGRPSRRSAAQPQAARQLRHVHVGHDPRHLQVGDQRPLRRARSASSGCRSSSAASSS